MLRGRFPFDQRATLAQNPTGKKLFEIMARKQSNLAVAADVHTVQQLFQLAEQVRLAWQAGIFDVLDICLAAWTLLASGTQCACSSRVLSAWQVGPHICCLKTHVDIFDTWDPSTAAQLRQLADKHGARAACSSCRILVVVRVMPVDVWSETRLRIADFLIFEDRKFADIGNTVVSQYGGGIYRMSEWSDLVNAHMVRERLPRLLAGSMRPRSPSQDACLRMEHQSCS